MQDHLQQQAFKTMVALLDLSFRHYQLLRHQHRKKLASNVPVCNFTQKKKGKKHWAAGLQVPLQTNKIAE